MRFRGIWPILYAFFTPEGRLDRDAMRRQTLACVAAGAHGLAVLGLATEVTKLSEAERRDIVAWAAADLAGAIPLAVTVFGATLETQRAALAHAADHGAAVAILQPPRTPGITETELEAFFGAVLADTPLPAGIQNAPEYIGIGLAPDAILRLHRTHGPDKFALLKAEASATTLERIVAAAGPDLAVFNGRGGLELPDVLRAGAAGLIPAPDCIDRHVMLWDAFQAGDDRAVEQLYREVLPATVFALQSIDTLVTCGKRILAARLGLPVVDRPPHLAPTPFGLAATARLADALGPLGAA